jgi:hypothetical protein
MGWFRSNCGFAAAAAFLALPRRPVLSFGHISPDGFGDGSAGLRAADGGFFHV